MAFTFQERLGLLPGRGARVPAVVPTVPYHSCGDILLRKDKSYMCPRTVRDVVSVHENGLTKVGDASCNQPLPARSAKGREERYSMVKRSGVDVSQTNIGSSASG